MGSVEHLGGEIEKCGATGELIPSNKYIHIFKISRNLEQNICYALSWMRKEFVSISEDSRGKKIRKKRFFLNSILLESSETYAKKNHQIYFHE